MFNQFKNYQIYNEADSNVFYVECEENDIIVSKYFEGHYNI